MPDLKDEILVIISNLKNVLLILDGLNDTDFKENVKKINVLINSISNKRKELLSAYSETELKNYNIELDILTKQIKDKFDYIINDIKNNQKEILFNIGNTNNKKKIVNYFRN